MNSKHKQSLWVLIPLAGGLIAEGCSDDKSLQPSVLPTSKQAQADGSQQTALETPEALDQFPAKAITWELPQQIAVVPEGADLVAFRFRMTNVSHKAVCIERINTSCGCTTVETKELPFHVLPGDSEILGVSMNVAGKYGRVTKSILVQGGDASWSLLATADITTPTDEISGARSKLNTIQVADKRESDLQVAKADRQAVFKGNCGGCHSLFAEGQFGARLYLAACAICHDAEHRASFVPELHATSASRNKDYWRKNVTDGIAETLMPAFAKRNVGILNDEQIESLVDYLSSTPLKQTPQN